MSPQKQIKTLRIAFICFKRNNSKRKCSPLCFSESSAPFTHYRRIKKKNTTDLIARDTYLRSKTKLHHFTTCWRFNSFLKCLFIKEAFLSTLSQTIINHIANPRASPILIFLNSLQERNWVANTPFFVLWDATSC